MTQHYVNVKEWANPYKDLTLDETYGPYTLKGATRVARQRLGNDYLNYPRYSIEEFHYNDESSDLPLLKLKVTGWLWGRHDFEQGICRVATVSR